MNKIRPFVGEVVGTFLLVLFGCGAVATAIATGANSGLFQIAAVWGLGVALAIAITGPISGAHLNPAVTLAFALVTPDAFPARKIPLYFAAQFLGAFLAASLLYLLFGTAIGTKEVAEGIQRGSEDSVATAMIFGEYFPPPGSISKSGVSHFEAFLAELVGTALLTLAIFTLTDQRNSFNPGKATPLAIGLVLTSIICLLAPVSMGGFNPARDLAPRIFSSIAGWGSLPFSYNGIGWLTVYVIAPCIGGPLGAIAARLIGRFFEEPEIPEFDASSPK